MKFELSEIPNIDICNHKFTLKFIFIAKNVAYNWVFIHLEF